MIKKLNKIDVSSYTLLFLISTLIGCAAVTYEEPKSGPVARVRFVSDTEGMTVIRSYQSKECDNEKEMMRLKKGFYLGCDSKRLNMPLWNYDKNAAKEFFIKADIPQVYVIESTNYIRPAIIKCGVFLEHTFDKGKDYELSYHSYYWNKYNCYLNVYEIKTNNLGESRKILLRKISNKLPENFSKTCLTKFKGFRWY